MGARGAYDKSKRLTDEQRDSIPSEWWDMADRLAWVLARELSCDRDDAYEEVTDLILRLARTGKLWTQEHIGISWPRLKHWAAREIIERRQSWDRPVALPRTVFDGTAKQREALRPLTDPWLAAGQGQRDLINKEGPTSIDEYLADPCAIDPADEVALEEILGRLPEEVREVVLLRMEGVRNNRIQVLLDIDAGEIDRRLVVAGGVVAGIMAEARRIELGPRIPQPRQSQPKPRVSPPQSQSKGRGPSPDSKASKIRRLAEEHGLSPCTLESRLARGWPLDKALNTPVRRRGDTVADRAVAKGLKPGTVHSRMARGETEEQALADRPPTRRARLEALAEEHGIPYSTLLSRVNKGQDPEVAARTPVKPKPPASNPPLKIWPRGEIARLAREHDVPYEALWYRLQKLNWPLDKALSTPIRRCK